MAVSKPQSSEPPVAVPTHWPVPNSSARDFPSLRVPEGACDSHIHIYDPDYAGLTAVPEHADERAYRQLQSLLQTSRTVVVQPRNYGTDNTVTLNAIRSLGEGRTRGIAVIDPDISEKELLLMNDAGIRGVRFSFYLPNAAAGDFDSVQRVAHKIAPFDWHLQLHWNARQIVEQKAMLERLPTHIVFDHMARLPTDVGSHPAYDVIERLLGQGRTWVKLSGAYLNSCCDKADGYKDTVDVAKWLTDLAPDRLVWGSDWPHVTEQMAKPDDAELVDLLAQWCGNDQALIHRVLVDNPGKLYRF